MDDLVSVFGKQLATIGPIGVFVVILFFLWLRYGPGGKDGPTVLANGHMDRLVTAIVNGVNESWQQERTLQRETGLAVSRLEAHEAAETQVFNQLIQQIQRLADTIDRIDRRGEDRRRR